MYLQTRQYLFSFKSIFDKSDSNSSLPCPETFKPKTFLKPVVLNRFWQRPSRNHVFYNVFEFLQLELVLPRNLQPYNFLKKSTSQLTMQSTIQSTIQWAIQSATESTTQLTTQHLKTYTLTTVGSTFFMHH